MAFQGFEDLPEVQTMREHPAINNLKTKIHPTKVDLLFNIAMH